MPGSSSSSGGGGGGANTATTALCAFAAGASLGAAATLVYARHRLGAALPEVPADGRAAPLLSGVVARLPPAARPYLPFSLEAYHARRRLGGGAAAVLDEGAAPATPTHGEAAAQLEDDGGTGTGIGIGTGIGNTTAATPPAARRQPSDLLLPLALTQRTDAATPPPGGGGGGGGGAATAAAAADRVPLRSVPLSSMGDLSESSALATPRGGDRGPPPSPPLRRAAVEAAATAAAAAAAATAAPGKPPRPASSGSGKAQQQQQQQQAGATPAPPPTTQSRPSTASSSEYKLCLVVRGDLRWPRQKTAVMCSHASVAAWKKAWKGARGGSSSSAGGASAGGGGDAGALAKWEREKSPKVVLRAEGEAALDALLERAKAAGLPTHAMSEVAGAGAGVGGEGGDGGPPPLKSRVILAIGPAPSEAINVVVGDLKLV